MDLRRRPLHSPGSRCRAPGCALCRAGLALPILPVLNLSVFASGELVHDRYLYLPSIGLALLIGLGLSRLKVGRVQWFGQPALRFAGVLLLTLGLGFATVNQHQYWASEL